jgi:hypothetical protein
MISVAAGPSDPYEMPMSDENLPPCGLYKTTREVAGVPAGRLVYFHNHGDPGPGVYLPSGWKANRAQWHGHGHTLGGAQDAEALEPLAVEGFYRVKEAFHCCEKKCRLFEPNTMVQLGYNGTADALLFVPELVETGLSIPERGTRIDREAIDKLELLKVAAPRKSGGEAPPPGEMLH